MHRTHIIGTETLDLAALCIDPQLHSYYELQSEIRHNQVDSAMTDNSRFFAYSRDGPSTWSKYDDEECTPMSPFNNIVITLPIS